MLLWQSMRHHCVPRTVSTGTWQESGHRWCDRWGGCLGGCRWHYGQEYDDSRTGAGHDNQRDSRSADESTTNDHHEELVGDLLWLWILLGILALCCLLSLCG